MSLLKHCSLVCLGLLAAVSVMAGEADESAPLTLEQVDRAQDLYLDQIQNCIVEVSAKPTKEAFANLVWFLNHAKNSDKSPFDVGFQYYNLTESSNVAKSARPKSSRAHRMENNINEIFSKALKIVGEAQRAFESGNESTFVLRLKSTSKEVVKVGAVLDEQRKNRAPQAAVGKGLQPVAGATKPQNGAAPTRK